MPSNLDISRLATRALFGSESDEVSTTGVTGCSAMSQQSLVGDGPEDAEQELPAATAMHLVVIPDGQDPQVFRYESTKEFQQAVVSYEGQEVTLVPFLGTHLRMATLPKLSDPRAVVFSDGNYIMVDGSDRELDADEVSVTNYAYMGRIRLLELASPVAESDDPDEFESTSESLEDESQSFLDELVG